MQSQSTWEYLGFTGFPLKFLCHAKTAHEYSKYAKNFTNHDKTTPGKKFILLTHEMESVLWWEYFQSIRVLLEILLHTKTEQEYKASEKC
jgi:hypothetical protein